jgi:pimeloyl-ACP methyl ester carboxylesterase
LITFQSGSTRIPLFFFHGDWGGDGLYCGHVAQKLGDDQPFYVLPPYRSGKKKILTVREMVDYHLAVMRQHTPHGPYLLGGYCIGATLTVEVARRRLEQGEKVEHLLLVDPPLGKAPSLPAVWRGFDIVGNILNWDLLKKIQYFDRYGVSVILWSGVVSPQQGRRHQAPARPRPRQRCARCRTGL